MIDQQISMLLSMLKIDLGISTNAYDSRLGGYLRSAEKEINREGITLDLEDVGDCQILVMYSAWMWRRRDSMDGMPRMLRYALNNRLFSEKV